MTNKKFKTIGIGVAFSPNLKANLYEAARLSLSFKSKLVLIHVGEKSRKKKEQILDIIQPFLKDNLSYDLVFKTGNPVDVILSVSEEKKVDLLILGALQKENFVQYYLGTIARKITRQANCSILLLIKPSVERIPCKHIVVNGLDNPKTKQTITTAYYLSHKLQSKKITIVEEITKQEIAVSVDDDKSLRKYAIIKERLKMREDSRINSIINEIPDDYKSNIVTKTQSIFGTRGYSIGHYAQFVRADLLVMNAPTKTSFWDRLFPHDIEYILSELPTDVLIIQ
ncbi:universal stress protein [Psychroserpens burtonensis]|uniref:Universal stress protein n=1 Tax=Psychroserpens burtonensis TaxID=49278 RepID=A0A5C7B9W4_9FLAO|nr:universal stress protein [Psychroserpens burtonensis]TXE19146.1 universal stress protein [Psychroserpens burtonensis]